MQEHQNAWEQGVCVWGGFSGGSMVKNLPANAGDTSSTPGPGRSHMWWFSCSVISDSCNPMDSTHQAPPSMGFSRQEYWSGLPFPSPEDLPDPGIEPSSSVLKVVWSPALQADSLLTELPEKTECWRANKPMHCNYWTCALGSRNRHDWSPCTL